MKTVQQIMQETGAEANIRNFRYMQENYTYKQKIRHAENVARSYQDKCSEMGLNCHISVGGLDSITLHYFLEACGVHVPCVSCSSLEQKGVQAVHKQIAAEMENTYSAREWLGAHMALPQDEIDTITDPDTRAQEQALHDACPPVPRMYFLKPLKPKTKVIEELGWPVLSKEIAGKISLLQNPTPKNATVRHAIITGETGEYGGFQKNSRMKLSQRWLEKFGGADAEGAALGYEAAPFKVSERCCYYLKEKPCDDWAKEHNSVPYLGLMASEGGRREKSLMMHGCNYYGKSTIRSAPFAIWAPPMRALYDVIVDGVTAREQPMIFETTTAGTVREGLYDDLYQEAENVINGFYDDNGYKNEHFLPIIYELDSRKEWTDESCWAKANPGLGTIKSVEQLRAKVQKAIANPKLVKNLLCKDFNIPETIGEAWWTAKES